MPIGLRSARAIAYAITYAMLFAATALKAQSSGQQSLMWLDIGGAAIQQPQGATRPAGSFGIGGLHQRRAWTLMGDAALTMANDSVAASQLVVRSLWTPTRAPWSTTEVEASLLSAGMSWRGADGSRSIALRERVNRRGIEAFVLGGVAAASRGTLNTRGAALHLGLSATRGAFSASASFQHAITDDYVLAEASGYFLREFPSNYAMRDATGSVVATSGCCRRSDAGVAPRRRQYAWPVECAIGADGVDGSTAARARGVRWTPVGRCAARRSAGRLRRSVGAMDDWRAAPRARAWQCLISRDSARDRTRCR